MGTLSRSLVASPDFKLLTKSMLMSRNILGVTFWRLICFPFDDSFFFIAICLFPYNLEEKKIQSPKHVKWKQNKFFFNLK